MAAGRMLKQTIATDKRLNDLSIEAEYLYLKAIPHLDRDGLIHGDADVLCGTVCPRRFAAIFPKVDGIKGEWIDAGLVTEYESEEGAVLYFAGFQKNQNIRYDREAASIFPPPPGYVRTASGLVRADNGNGDGVPLPDSPPNPDNDELTPDLLPPNSGPTPAQNKLKEDQNKGRSREQQPHARDREPSPPGNVLLSVCSERINGDGFDSDDLPARMDRTYAVDRYERTFGLGSLTVADVQWINQIDERAGSQDVVDDLFDRAGETIGKGTRINNRRNWLNSVLDTILKERSNGRTAKRHEINPRVNQSAKPQTATARGSQSGGTNYDELLNWPTGSG